MNVENTLGPSLVPVEVLQSAERPMAEPTRPEGYAVQRVPLVLARQARPACLHAAPMAPRDVVQSPCTSHASACGRTIADDCRPHSVVCAECGKLSDSCMPSSVQEEFTQKVMTSCASLATKAPQPCCVVQGEPDGRVLDVPDGGRGRHDG